MQITTILEHHAIYKKVFVGILTTFFVNIRKLVRRKVNNNIAIICFHRLGDTVFTLPAIKRCIEIYSEKRIFIFTFEETGSVLEEALKDQDVQICKSEKNMVYLDRIASGALRKLFKQVSPGIILDLTGSVLSASLIFGSTAQEIIGMNQEYYQGLYDKYIPKRKIPHLMDMYFDVINEIQVVSEREKYFKFTKNYDPKQPIFIHSFAGWKAKEWSFDKYILLASLLLREHEICFISEEKVLTDEMRFKIRNSGFGCIETKSIKDLINHIRSCSIFISNDSGPLYVAAMVGKPTFTIYGPTNPDYSIPRGNHHSFVRKKLPCTMHSEQYCIMNGGLICPHIKCQNSLTVEEVYQALKEFKRRIC